MKTRLFFFITLALLTWACDNDPIDDSSLEEAQSEEITAEVEIATVEDLMQDTEAETDRLLALRSDSSSTGSIDNEPCVQISRVPETGFPATLTIDFGDGCTGPNGRVRAGQILVRQTDSLSKAGAERMLTFNQFSVDGVQIEGERLLTNQGANTLGQPTWQRVVKDAVFTFPDGTTLTWNSTYTRTQIRGARTATRIDDIFATDGFTEGVSRRGNAFSHVIAEPLIKSRDCRWIQAGVLEITRGDRMRTVTFGNGFCDPVATITFPNGESRRILLDRKWWQRQNG